MELKKYLCTLFKIAVMQFYFNIKKHKRMVLNGPHDFVGYFFVEANPNKNRNSMYKELKKFKVSNQFSFTIDDSLEEVCNASEGSGVFLVYAVAEEKELIMVGSTGTVQNDGTLKIKNGGLKDKIVNGHQFAKTGRKYSWPAQMKIEDISVLEVVWYETFNDTTKGIPTSVEGQVLQNFLDENGRLPKWNVAF